MSKETKMQALWSNISENYGNAVDLEEKQRILVAEFLSSRTGNVLELACGNGKVLQKMQQYNPHLQLSGIDYNEEMIAVARKSLPNIGFISGDIHFLSHIYQNTSFNTIICINSLHNLPQKQSLKMILSQSYAILPVGGYFIFDVRNRWNPFLSYGYYKNRKKGLNFWTNDYISLVSYAQKIGFSIERIQGIYYETRNRDFFHSRFRIINFLYNIYIYLTHFRIFSPYIFIILEKK